MMRDSAKPSGSALKRHNLGGGQLFDADPGQLFAAD
jgi:hypothetical protein